MKTIESTVTQLIPALPEALSDVSFGMTPFEL